MAAYLIDALLAFASYIRSGKAAEVLPTVEELTGRQPYTFAQWARVHADAFARIRSENHSHQNHYETKSLEPYRYQSTGNAGISRQVFRIEANGEGQQEHGLYIG